MVSFLDEIRKIENKWQKKWQEDEIFVANVDNSKPKWFLTVSYPYATSPLHIGHARTYGLGDIFARFKRQRGYNVLWPMGFHITGTPVLAVSWKIKNNEEKEWAKMRGFISNYDARAMARVVNENGEVLEQFVSELDPKVMADSINRNSDLVAEMIKYLDPEAIAHVVNENERIIPRFMEPIKPDIFTHGAGSVVSKMRKATLRPAKFQDPEEETNEE